ncbi:MAG TPA: winged helix-turn-helix domain-containing protein [Spirochaetia bacterium]|nr:winged helix-turn-helix domain-containing protein [Spirochaetia bacterium]
MEKQIAECARRVIATLAALGEVNVLRLAEHLGERSVLTYQALGWLAHEGRLRYSRRGSQVYVSLGPDRAEAQAPS